jgi:hypothetical protein
MANYSYKKTDRGNRAALCQLGLQFRKQFFSVFHIGECGKNTQSHLPQPIHNGCPAPNNGST